MMALAARRELGGGVRQHPGSNNCVEGAYGIARFAEREAVESDGHTRSTCGVRELRDSPVRRSVRQRAAAGERVLVANGRCWRCRESAPRAGVQQRATNTTLAVTRRHQRRAIAQQRTTNTTLAVTRRHQRRATAQQRATNTTLAATRRHR